MENETVVKKVWIHGQYQSIDIVANFILEQTGKEYIIYTLNESKNDRVVLYASIVTEKDGKLVFETIPDEEWLLIKEKMRQVIHSEGGNA